MTKPPPWFEAFSSEERAARAKECVEATVTRVREVIDLDEQTARVCVDDTLRDSLPAGSPALPAFDRLRFTLYWFKVVRLISLWDPSEENSYSIPTVLSLIKDDSVIAVLQRETHDHFAALTPRQWNRSDDPILRAEMDRVLRGLAIETARDEAGKQRDLIRKVIEQAERRCSESTTAGIRNARHYIGHHIQRTRKEADQERNNKQPVRPPTFNDVEDLLATTVNIAQGLYLAVNGHNYEMDEVRSIGAKMAAALWDSCRFSGA